MKSKVYLHSTAQNQNPGIFIRDMESLTSLRKISTSDSNKFENPYQIYRA
ncbi:hypothetical protein LBBP_04145 [Leptospira borgpetersenii serovar Ballum]|uniref:Uncharacterized protein n=1 Tax=Leptospira borgpetersenii serovar Ballum TaxID=280505 RepID=A0A0S2IYA2_LEPBO|nr:hypothetical protein LBBP_04145 [Leptospira borgpetersenii serovar Ballum]